MSKGEFEILNVIVPDASNMLVKIRMDEDQIEVRYLSMKTFIPNLEKDEIRMFVDIEDEELKKRIYRFLDNEFKENKELKLAVLMFFGEEYYEN